MFRLLYWAELLRPRQARIRGEPRALAGRDDWNRTSNFLVPNEAPCHWASSRKTKVTRGRIELPFPV